MKPPVIQSPMDHQERVSVDTSDGSPFEQLMRVAMSAADAWTFSDDGPYKTSQTAAQAARSQVREAMLHLLELGLIDIDAERLTAMEWIPMDRRPA